MNASNKEHLILHADAEWMKDILKRIDNIIKQQTEIEDKLVQIEWLVKQALKVERED